MANRSDNFNRANSTTSFGTPSDGGSAWVPVVGTWGITSNKGYIVTAPANSKILLETSTSSFTYSLDWLGSPYASSSAVNGMYFRYVDANNYMLLLVSGLALYVGKVVAGTYTQVGSTYSGSMISGDNISVSVDAVGSIVVKQNGTTRITTTSNVNNSGTQVGIYANGYTGYQWDNLVVTDNIAVPGAPTIGSATASYQQALVTFIAPVSNGGATITGYTATSTPSSLTASGVSSPLTVTGLTNGTTYTFTVHATNSVGNSPESATSNSVTPRSGVPVVLNKLRRKKRS